MCATRTVTITLTQQFKITFLSLVALTALAMILGCAIALARTRSKARNSRVWHDRSAILHLEARFWNGRRNDCGEGDVSPPRTTHTDRDATRTSTCQSLACHFGALVLLKSV